MGVRRWRRLLRPRHAGRLLQRLMRIRRRMRTALERMLDWDFDQIIVGHGAVVENDGRKSFARRFDGS